VYPVNAGIPHREYHTGGKGYRRDYQIVAKIRRNQKRETQRETYVHGKDEHTQVGRRHPLAVSRQRQPQMQKFSAQTVNLTDPKT
jgi:hypothetical protein